jgi:glucokinase
MGSSDLLEIYSSEKNIPGNIAIIAPGTGLGEAAMYWDGKRYHPFASEGGHCDFSPRDNTDINMLMFLQHKYGHVSWERVASGMGIVNIFDFLRTSADFDLKPELESELLAGDVAANISKAAMEGEKVAIETMKLFVRYLSIEASNTALKFKSTGGLYIGGGIIPKIWNEDYKAIFLKHFFEVGRLEPLLRCTNVTIIMNSSSVLFGAAHSMVSKLIII